MDPLSSVGLAAAIVQFVTFTSSFISTAREIHASPTGNTAEVLNLRLVSQNLQQRGEDLTAAHETIVQLGSSNTQASVLGEILESARQDHEKLSGLVDELKRKTNRSHRWSSFCATLKAVIEGSEIRQLDNRLQRTQSAITLHICTIIRYS